MKTKTFITAIVLTVLHATTVTAQQEKVVFQYDDSGNRISRHLEVQKSAEADSLFIDEMLLYSESELEAVVYPNPTSGLITIEVAVSADNPITYVVADQNGKLIETGQFSQSSYPINLSNQQTGIYYLRLNDRHGKVTYKIIKQ
jgi:ketopantoate reductase